MPVPVSKCCLTSLKVCAVSTPGYFRQIRCIFFSSSKSPSALKSDEGVLLERLDVEDDDFEEPLFFCFLFFFDLLIFLAFWISFPLRFGSGSSPVPPKTVLNSFWPTSKSFGSSLGDLSSLPSLDLLRSFFFFFPSFRPWGLVDPAQPTLLALP